MARGKPLGQETLKFLLDFMAQNQWGKTELAKQIGVPRSTLADALRGQIVFNKTKGKIRQFIAEARQEVGETVIGDIPLPKITGDEQPKIDSAILRILLTEFKIGADLLVATLKRFANGDVGSRKVFHQSFGKEFQDLYTLVRALSSESMLEIVRKETGKQELP